MRRLLSIACVLASAAFGQANLKFQEGALREVPKGWFVLDAVKDAGYTAEWRRDGCHTELPCAILAAPAAPPPKSFGTLMQSFDAAPYRGKKVRLRAWIRIERKGPEDRAQMLLHVGRPNFLEGFLDNMADRPIIDQEWRRYEIHGEVAPDAEAVRIGFMLYGLGRVTMSEVEFGPETAVTSGPAVDAAREAIAKQYARMDAAFVRHDTNEIRAVLQPDAQMRVGTIHEPLLPAIEGEMSKGSKLTTQTTIANVLLDGDEAVAVVRRQAADPTAEGRSVVTSHRDSWTRGTNGWRLTESVEVSYHWVLPATGAEAARPVVAELRKRAVPLTGSDDLAAFGAAVGEARIVALGEAARGTREFSQLKRRLLEYLVKEKGFSVVLAPDDPAVRELAKQLNCEFALIEGPTMEAQVTNIVRAANVVHAQAKIVVWTDNAHARDPLLRDKLGRKLYAAGFAFRRGEISAVGVEGGESRGYKVFNAPASPEGSGDAVFSAAEMPQFFLAMTSLPFSGPLAHWLGDLHLYHDMGAYWVLDDPDASLVPLEFSKNYDGLFFVEELHAGG